MELETKCIVENSMSRPKMTLVCLSIFLIPNLYRYIPNIKLNVSDPQIVIMKFVRRILSSNSSGSSYDEFSCIESLGVKEKL